MDELPGPAPKLCGLRGCTAKFPPLGRRRFCDQHRGRPWLELWIVRARHGLTIRELAQRSGIPFTYVHHLEQGQRSPSERHVRLLAKAARVRESDLTPRADTVIPPHLAERRPGPVGESKAAS